MESGSTTALPLFRLQPLFTRALNALYKEGILFPDPRQKDRFQLVSLYLPSYTLQVIRGLTRIRSEKNSEELALTATRIYANVRSKKEGEYKHVKMSMITAIIHDLEEDGILYEDRGMWQLV